MTRLSWPALGIIAVLLAAGPAPACNLCNPNFQQTLSWRQEAAQARLVLYGTLENARLAGDGGTTDLRVKAAVKQDPSFPVGAVVPLPRYVPVTDPKDPPRYVVFCDVYDNKLDPYRGVPCKSDAAVAYLKGAMALDGKDRTQTLLYYFRYLEDADKEVAADAFLEFAKANDREIGQVAGKLSADKLRGWLKDTQTQSYRLGLYAFLLGSCGGDQDAALLRSMLEDPGDQTTAALDGILGGYIRLRPREGWELALALLRDEKKPFPVRYTVLRTLRFYHGYTPEETRGPVLQGLGAAIAEGDLADLAVEDLRRWQWWDLTTQVLAQYGKPSHSAPIMRRAIVRYALCCPKPEAAAFVAERRRAEPDVVKDVEEALQFEKPK